MLHSLRVSYFTCTDLRHRLLPGCSYLVAAGLGGCLPGRWNCAESPGRNVPVVGVCDQ